MKIVELNEGKKIGYELDGTMLGFADGALYLNLARYQRDEAVKKDIMIDDEGYLTTGRGRYYAAQVEIPAMQYQEEVQEAEEETAENAGAEGADEAGGMEAEQKIVRTPLPLDTDEVKLYLFAVDGIVIH